MIGTLIGSLELGLIFAIMSLGIFITFRILDFPDLTVDGSFTLGCVVGGVLALYQHPVLAIIAGSLAGSLAGLVTALLHTKIKVNYILAGILTMTGLYSINLKIGGVPNFSLFGKATVFSIFKQFMGSIGLGDTIFYTYATVFLMVIIVTVLVVVLYLFFRTPVGLAIRATGDNEEMVRASSINTDLMKIIALMLANGLVALSGGIYTQYSLYFDISAGIGMMVIGLCGIIIGESVFGKRTILNSLVSSVLGAVVYRIILTIALEIGMDPNDWKLLCVFLVIVIISLPLIKDRYFQYQKKANQRRGGHA